MAEGTGNFGKDFLGEDSASGESDELVELVFSAIQKNGSPTSQNELLVGILTEGFWKSHTGEPAGSGNQLSVWVARGKIETQNEQFIVLENDLGQLVRLIHQTDAYGRKRVLVEEVEKRQGGGYQPARKTESIMGDYAYVPMGGGLGVTTDQAYY